jgi:hypothetical protein
MKRAILLALPLAAVLTAFGRNPSAALPASEQRAPEFRLPAGTPLRVRIGQSLDTGRNRSGDHFQASLAAPVTIQGKVVLPAGTGIRGHVTSARPSGRLRGRGHIALALDSFEFKGRTHPIATSPVSRTTRSHKRRNFGLIGGGSGAGALIGGLAGGGKGALIGAGAGAVAGTAGAAVTGRKQVHIPAESVFTFRLKGPVSVEQTDAPPRTRA